MGIASRANRERQLSGRTQPQDRRPGRSANGASPPCRPSRRRSLQRTDGGRSGLAAGTGLHAPKRPLVPRRDNAGSAEKRPSRARGDRQSSTSHPSRICRTAVADTPCEHRRMSWLREVSGETEVAAVSSAAARSYRLAGRRRDLGATRSAYATGEQGADHPVHKRARCGPEHRGLLLF